ncbi:MAG: YncE family protein [Geobacter sp.]|nr:YncE family protein [Geobacter sp.]
MKFKSLMTAGCLLAAATSVYAQPFAYVAHSGKNVATGKFNVSVIDTATNAVTATVDLTAAAPPAPQPYPYSVAVSASGQKVFVGLQTANQVQVIDAATNAVVKVISLGTDSPGGLAVNAAETRLYVTSNMSNTLIVIDISGSGASEVARVAVDDASISNPEGVVINPAGTKAYVANSTTSNIAEITLDETNNVYTRTSLTSVNGSQPLGLAISSDGAKLYYSSLGGSAGVMTTATKALKSLPVGTGTLALAPTHGATSPMIYAPSNSLDKLYVIDGTTDTVSGTTYAVASAPAGAAVNPANTKLYLAMNASDNVKVFDLGSNTVTNTISLSAGAKPLSMGDFMGPLLPYTITATSDTSCTIAPAGSVLVNNLGRTFTSTGTPCEILVDGATQGQISSYTFSNVAANHSIASSPLYSVACTVTSSNGLGYLVSTPAGINQANSSALFSKGANVTLTPATNYVPSAWTGDCAGTADGASCVHTNLSANKSCGVYLTYVAPAGGPFYNVNKAAYYQNWADCAAAASADDYIKVANTVSTLTTTGTAGLRVKMTSQWLPTDNTTKGTYAPLALTIKDVAVIAGDGSDPLKL